MKIHLPLIIKRLILIVILAFVYYETAEVSRLLASTPQNVTPVWPPDGFASAAVFLFGYWILPGVLIGSILSNFWAFTDFTNNWTYFSSTLPVIAIAIGTTLGTYLGIYLFKKNVKKRIKNPYPLARVKDSLKFLVLIGIIGTSINATFGVTALTLGGKIPLHQYFYVWFTWWVSNISGIFIFTPALLCWYQFFKHNIAEYDLVST